MVRLHLAQDLEFASLSLRLPCAAAIGRMQMAEDMYVSAITWRNACILAASGVHSSDASEDDAELAPLVFITCPESGVRLYVRRGAALPLPIAMSTANVSLATVQTDERGAALSRPQSLRQPSSSLPPKSS